MELASDDIARAMATGSFSQRFDLVALWGLRDRTTNPTTHPPIQATYETTPIQNHPLKNHGHGLVHLTLIPIRGQDSSGWHFRSLLLYFTLLAFQFGYTEKARSISY